MKRIILATLLCASYLPAFSAVNNFITLPASPTNTSAATAIEVTVGTNYQLNIQSTVTGLGGSCHPTTTMSLSYTTSGNPFTLSSHTGSGTNPISRSGANNNTAIDATFDWTPTSAQAGNTYSVTFTASNSGPSCGSADTHPDATVTLYYKVKAQPCDLSLSWTKTKISCNGGSNGTIDLTVNGTLSGASTYSWSGPDGFTASTEDLSGLSTGLYTVTVTNGACSTSLATPIHICQPTAVVIDAATPTDITCHDANNGTITVVASGGTGTLTYSDDNGANYQSGNVFNNLSGATYTILVKDANGCTSSSTTATVVNPPAITAVASVSQSISCHVGQGTNNDGAVSVTAGGGTGSLTYSWSPSGGTGSTASGLSAGTYYVTVTDANLCTKTSNSVTLSEPNAISANFVYDQYHDNSSCPNGTVFYGFDDYLNLGNVTGGTPGQNTCYSYTWGTGTSAYSSTCSTAVASLASMQAHYSVTITDANGCTLTVTSCSTVDARCPAGNSGVQKVAMCHRPGGSIAKQKTICIDSSAVDDHLFIGDLLGPCSSARLAANILEADIAVYPNPSTGIFNIDRANNADMDVLISDIQGRVILTKHFEAGNATVQIDMHTQLKGIYFMEVQNGDATFRTKLLVQ